MSKNNLYKGFEVELFTGSLNSHIGISNDIEKNFSNFVKEPDSRNVEYITTPEKDYKLLYEKLLTPRKNLRQWLKNKNLTIIPSSTLCFKHDIKIQRSDMDNVYHQYIEDNYTEIEQDMNGRNSSAKKKTIMQTNKTRKKREELSISATKSIKKEEVEIIVEFN